MHDHQQLAVFTHHTPLRCFPSLSKPAIKMPERFSSHLSVLERAQKQLHVQRLSISKGSVGGHSRAVEDSKKEDSDLNEYLNKLSRKVSQVSGKKISPTAGGFSDISISSDDENDHKEPANLLASRFVKKSQSRTLVNSRSFSRTDEVLTSGTTLKKSATMPNFLNKSAPVYASAALQRAAKLGAKFTNRKQSADDNLLGSDSEPDLSKSDNSGDYRTSKPKVNTRGLEKELITSISHHGYLQSNELISDATKFLKKSAEQCFYVGESDDDVKSTIGKDADRILKKSVSSKQPFAVDSEKESGSRFLKTSKKLAAQDKTFIKGETKKKHDNVLQEQFLHENTFLTSTPMKKLEAKARVPKLSKTLPTGKKIGLDSDEGDLQDFIMNMSSSSSLEIPLVRKQKPPPKTDKLKESQLPRQTEATVHGRPATPGVKKAVRHANVESMSVDSVSEKSAMSVTFDSNIMSENENVFKGIHKNTQVDVFEPPGVSAVTSRTLKAKVSSAEDGKDLSDEASDHSSVVENIFAGLQTVDDLLKREWSPNQQPEDALKNQLRDASNEDEILEALSEVTDASKKSRSKTAGGDSSELQSESFSESGTSTRTVPDSHSSVTSEDNTKQENSDLGHGSRTKRNQSYSDDFHSQETDSEVDDISTDNNERTRTESVTHSQSYTSYTESNTVTRSESTSLKTRRKTKKKDKLKDAAVQADEATSSTSHWLRALTSYSPSIISMNEMLRLQLRHTQETIQASLRLHQTLIESIEMDYTYTSLEETREYIRRHRRPKLTMKQAFDEVRQEMEERHS